MWTCVEEGGLEEMLGMIFGGGTDQICLVGLVGKSNWDLTLVKVSRGEKWLRNLCVTTKATKQSMSFRGLNRTGWFFV